MNWTSLGGRRFLLCAGAIALAALVLAFGKVSGAEFCDLTTWIVGIYVTGNTGQKAVEMRTTGLPAGTPVQQPVAATDTATVAAAKDEQ